MQKSRRLIQKEENAWTKVENRHDCQKYTTPLKKIKKKKGGNTEIFSKIQQ